MWLKKFWSVSGTRPNIFETIHLCIVSVAHSEVYGYGFRPYEYLTPPANPETMTIPEQQEAELGMYSMRSFLFPRIYSLFLFTKELLQIPGNPYLVRFISFVISIDIKRQYWHVCFIWSCEVDLVFEVLKVPNQDIFSQ